MNKPVMGIFDCEKQEQIFREMTEEEYVAYLADVEVIKKNNLSSGDNFGND